MNRQSLRLRSLPLLLATAAAAIGCSHTESHTLTDTASRRVPLAACAGNGKPLPAAPIQQVAPQEGGRMVVATGTPTLQGAGQVLQDAGQVVQDAGQVVQDAGQVEQAGGPGGLPDTFTQAAGENRIPPAADPEGVVQSIDRRALGREDSFHNRQDPAPRRAFVDLTAQPWFSHAADYSSLVGQLRFCKSQNRWRLRYASLDENDPYDGEVTLVDFTPLEHLQDGHYVRVVGHLVDPQKKESGSSYKVTSVQPIQKNGETAFTNHDGGQETTNPSK